MNKSLYSYKVFEQEKFIFAKYQGSFNVSQLIMAAEFIWNDPNYSEYYHGAVDMREAEVSLQLKDVKQLAKTLIKSPKRAKSHISVIVREKKTTGMATMLLHFLGGLIDIRLFQSPENAMKFVGKENEFIQFLEESTLKQANLQKEQVLKKSI